MNGNLPDKTGMSLVPIENEKQMRIWNVDSLAHSLWGKDVPRQYPVYVVFYYGRPVGFFVTVQKTCVYPALHPETMSTRAFIKIVRSLVTECKRMTGDPVFFLCDKAEKMSEKHMKMLRLKRAKEQAFEYCEEGN
jgi:hypothetical protein